MNKTTLLLILIMAASASAATTFTLSPVSGEPGQTVTVNLNLQNDAPIWGFSAKITESSPITFSTSTSGTRLGGGLSGATANTPDKTTVYSAFGGNTPGIPAGTGPIMTLSYTIPEATPAGEYQLDITELTVSDSEGNPLEATGTGAKIKVIAPLTKLKLPKVRGTIKAPVDVNICLSNTRLQRAVKSTNMVITHDPRIVKATSVSIKQGSGSHTIASDSVTIAVNGLNVQNADCDAQTGVNIATIRYTPVAAGTSALTFQSASATDQSSQPFSTQQFDDENGEITLDHCYGDDDCNEGGSCTRGVCEQGTCHYYTISGCGPGGGSGGSQQYAFTGCKTCSYEQYSCCGTNLEMINRMCERPKMYPGYCTFEGETTPTFSPTSEETEGIEQPTEQPATPAPEQTPAPPSPPEAPKVIAPTTGQATQTETTEAPKTETPRKPIDTVNTILWTMAILLFGASICTAYIIVKGKPTLPSPPSKIPILTLPSQAQPAPQQPVQTPPVQQPSTESSKVIDFIEKKSKEQ
ncbi:Cohesin domain protein [uncultured archaeon]|nr:Cohesin domain protein [uncultured archaeon]